MNHAGAIVPRFRVERTTASPAGLAVLLGSFVAPASGGQATEPPLRPLAYTRFTLPNGLVAILNEDHATPDRERPGLVPRRIEGRQARSARDRPPLRTPHVAGLAASRSTAAADFYRSLGGTSTHFAETLGGRDEVLHHGAEQRARNGAVGRVGSDGRAVGARRFATRRGGASRWWSRSDARTSTTFRSARTAS